MQLRTPIVLAAIGLPLALGSGSEPEPTPSLIGMDAETALILFGVPEATQPSRDLTIWSWPEDQAELVLMEDQVFSANPQATEAFAGRERPALGEPLPSADLYLGMDVQELARRAGPLLGTSQGSSEVALTFAGGLEISVVAGRVARIQR